jgi:hypothetical protein
MFYGYLIMQFIKIWKIDGFVPDKIIVSFFNKNRSNVRYKYDKMINLHTMKDKAL